MTPELRPLAQDEEVLANMIIAADTLHGGNVKIADAGARLIADQYPLDSVALPPAYHDDRAEKLREAGGAKPDLAEDVRGYIGDYELLNARAQLAEAFADASPQRKAFADNLGGAVEEMVKLALAQAQGDKLPDFSTRWEAAIKQAPQLADTAELQEALRAALASAGVEVGGGTLREALDIWDHRVGVIDRDSFTTEFATEYDGFLAQARRRLFAEAGLDVDDIPFDGLNLSTFHKPESHTSGSNLYIGGPAMKTHLQLNTGHPATRMGLKNLVAHEGMPGHYADSVLADLMWRKGKIGFEAMVSTMCTPDVVLREGWAQNALPALFSGPREALDALGPDFAVELAVEALIDAAKNDGVILMQRDGMDREALAKHLKAHHVLSDMFVLKILGWASHDLIGSMYGGAYRRGNLSVARAIEEHGVAKVAEHCFHQHGYHDIATFEAALAA
jgi:hypothetical protein